MENPYQPPVLDHQSRRATSRDRRVLIWLCFAGFVLLFVALLAPSLYHNTELHNLNTVINNLRMIEGAKDLWAAEHRKKAGDLPTEADITLYLKQKLFPRPVLGETYRINPIGVGATAITPVKLHSFEPGGTITIP